LRRSAKLLSWLVASLPLVAGAQEPLSIPGRSAAFGMVAPADREGNSPIDRDGSLPAVPQSKVAVIPEVSLPAAPAEESREIKDTITLPRPTDLTAEPDDLWGRIRNGFAVPDLEGPLVLERQRWYVANSDYLKRVIDRSKRYLYHIVGEIEKRGMPTEIALLPMVESAFNPMAYSRSHASGLWQFLPSTGKNYKLQQNWWYDSRRDVLASTTAALDYLQFLYDMHGDWYLALASYNWGENAVTRALAKNRSRGLPTDYQSIAMPRETRSYVPKLQALKNIIMNPAAFGIDLDSIPNQPYFVTVPKTQDMDILLAAQLAEMPVDDLISLNPANNRPVIPGSQTLVIPADRLEVFLANLENHDKPLVSWQLYTFKSGDTLERLAARHDITLARLKRVNSVTARSKVGPGTMLMLPIKGTNAGVEPLPAVFQPPVLPTTRVRKIVHVVKKGDTLPAIARRYRVSTEDLRYWNDVGALATGQRLIIKRTYTAPVRKSHAPLKKIGGALASVAAIKINSVSQ
jgi:membrane-bound lytic murein transglycosylase D